MELKASIDVDRNRVSFAATNGRTMFEIVPGNDGSSIEIRSTNTTKVGKTVFGMQLAVEPIFSNVVMVRTLPYHGR